MPHHAIVSTDMTGTELYNGREIAKLEARALRIDDPIERLRFLRKATSASAKVTCHRRLYDYVFVLLLILPMASDATGHAPEKIFVTRAATSGIHLDLPDVWMIEQAADHELYSNGLRIENRLAVANQPRVYRLEHRLPDSEPGPQRFQPAGIVYHTTESDQLPFEIDQTRALKQTGQELLLFVRNKRAYHYVIDRFSRVHRIVHEAETANHAGNSIWADSEWVYVDLNRSFLGIAFEARMSADQPPINPGQVHAAKILTEMLRSKYNLPAANCITHAQVSVNPTNMLIGWQIGRASCRESVEN